MVIIRSGFVSSNSKTDTSLTLAHSPTNATTSTLAHLLQDVVEVIMKARFNKVTVMTDKHIRKDRSAMTVCEGLEEIDAGWA